MKKSTNKKSKFIALACAAIIAAIPASAFASTGCSTQNGGFLNTCLQNYCTGNTCTSQKTSQDVNSVLQKCLTNTGNKGGAVNDTQNSNNNGTVQNGSQTCTGSKCATTNGGNTTCTGANCTTAGKTTCTTGNCTTAGKTTCTTGNCGTTAANSTCTTGNCSGSTANSTANKGAGTTVNNGTTKTSTTPATTKPSTTTTTPASGSNTSQVVTLVNKERAAAGLSALSSDSQLASLAQMKAEDMAKNNYFSHTSPTYGSAFDMMKKNGYSFSTAGENIAKGQKTASEVMTAWMNSSGHKANILGSSYTKIGVGYATDASGTAYWVQMFAG